MDEDRSKFVMVSINGSEPAAAPSISDSLAEKWQQIVDLMASITGVPTTMLIRVRPDGKKADVVVMNRGGDNPLQQSMSMALTPETYCYYVMRERRMIHVPDAIVDERWDKPPLGMRAYVGVPIVWPDGTLFGSMCLMNQEAGSFSDAIIEMLDQFRLAIESDLKSLVYEAETQRIRDQLVAAQRLASMGNWYWDAVSDVFEAGLTTYDLLGMQDSQIPMALADALEQTNLVLHPDYRKLANTSEDFLRVFSDEGVVIFKINHPDSGERWIRAVSSHKVDDKGDLLHVRGTIQDITDHVRLEEQARETALEQERTRMLVRFVRDLAHEIKTPLSVMETSLYILRRSDDADRRAQHVDRLHDQIVTVSNMIDALTQMARLDALDISERALVDLAVILREALGVVRMNNRERAISVYEDIPASLPKICGHEGELGIALINIIDNAFRYTLDGGAVRIETTVQDDSLFIAITDTGLGMDEAVRLRVFERFYRGDAARTTRGLGMGLSIAHKVVFIHQGNIEVKSSPGKGSTFTVVLPMGNSD